MGAVVTSDINTKNTLEGNLFEHLATNFVPIILRILDRL
jgi:hypothetical protein